MSTRNTSATPTYRFNGHYPAAIAACEGLPLVIPLNLPEPILRAVFERLDGLCLPGGVDVDPAEYGEASHPDLGSVDYARDRTELLLAKWALEANLPVLGICRGIQLLNVAGGGTLYQHLPAQLPDTQRHDYRLQDSAWETPTHEVRIEPESKLAAAVGKDALRTNSFHHQAVKDVAPGFHATAWAEDGVVEAIESEGQALRRRRAVASRGDVPQRHLLAAHLRRICRGVPEGLAVGAVRQEQGARDGWRL